MNRSRFLSRISNHWGALRRDNSGLALIEFAFIAPIMLLLGIGGIELVNYTIANLRLSQAAVHVADNGSRIGDRDQLAVVQEPADEGRIVVATLFPVGHHVDPGS